MQTSRLAMGRIPPLRRPLRPPSALAFAPANQHPKPRLFTHNSQHLLVMSPSVGPRPQLPFLHPSTRSSLRLGPHARTVGGQWQLARLLTTDTKKYIKEQVWLASKWTVFLWTSVGLLFIAYIGVENEMLERRNPSPPEWSVITRMNYVSARAQEDPDFWPSGLTDWASTGTTYQGVLERLEDPKIDGAGLKEQSEGGILVPGVGKAGYDVSAQSEAWRRGYHETLMGCAKAAEHLDGWVKDTTRRICFPPEVVIGPSNPNPRPCPPYAHDAPLEQNCIPAFDAPETYYMKILTTAGFSTRQRLDAALAYADWLDFKGLSTTATEMYTWALDIATAPLPDAASIIDPATGIIRDSTSADRVSPNVARAATALATHHARTANVSAALPIFLSVLRARQAAPPGRPSTTPSSSNNTGNGILATIRSFLSPPAYPPPPPSGDDALTRTPAARCDDAALKTYISEILFATSASQRDMGLAWAREAVAEAEAETQNEALSGAERERCAQCAEVALGNLGKMVGVLAREEKEKGGSKGGWLSWGKKGEEEGVWERERVVVEERIERMRREGLREQFAKMERARGLTWIG